MKEENQKKIFELLKPNVEFLKEKGYDAKACIFRSNYGAIKVPNIKVKDFNELHNKLKNNRECSIFCCEEWLGDEYILFSFIIDGKWSHAWE